MADAIVVPDNLSKRNTAKEKMKQNVIKDGNIAEVVNGNINSAIKKWRNGLVKYGTFKALKARSLNPAPRARQREKRIRAEQNRKRREGNSTKVRYLKSKTKSPYVFIYKGKRIEDVQELLGHKDIKMTMRYAHLTQEHKRKAVNLLNKLTAPVTENAICHKSVTNSNRPNINVA